MVVVDTNIIIDHLRQKSPDNSPLNTLIKKLGSDNVAISILSIQELYEGKSMMDTEKEQIMLSTIEKIAIFPYSFDVAKKAGELARAVKAIEFPDAAIAATAMVNGAELATLNKKDFEGIAELKLFD